MDTNGCVTTDDLLHAAVMKSGFKTHPEIKSIWAVRLEKPDIDNLLTIMTGYGAF